jgi:hypothetical protein
VNKVQLWTDWGWEMQEDCLDWLTSNPLNCEPVSFAADYWISSNNIGSRLRVSDCYLLSLMSIEL